jgi:hypothetical protein
MAHSRPAAPLAPLSDKFSTDIVPEGAPPGVVSDSEAFCAATNAGNNKKMVNVGSRGVRTKILSKLHGE